MPTIKDVAKRANVSVATVSYVLNSSRPVHPDKKERILQAIEELDYTPNATARGLRVKRNKTIGLVIPDIMNPFYPDLAKGCQDAAKESGYTLMMYNTDDQEGQLSGIIKEVKEGKVDGLILASLKTTERNELQELLELSFPVVLAHRGLEQVEIDSVVADNFTGAYDAAKHFVALGHRKIAFMNGIERSPASEQRRNGYLAAMKSEALRKWVVAGEGKYQTGYTTAYKLLQQPVSDRPTAILASSDLMALAVMDAAKDLALSVPEDIAVIGYDNLFIASFRSIALTTVHVPRYEIGQEAAKLLIGKMEESKKCAAKKPSNQVLQTNLVIRKTCGIYQG